MIIVTWIVTLAVISCLPAVIAKNKGRSFGGWWLYGFLLFPIALIHSLVAPANVDGLEEQALANGNRKCPHCAEMVKVAAQVCKHCGNKLDPYVPEIDPNAPTEAQKWVGRIVVVGGLLALAIIVELVT